MTILIKVNWKFSGAVREAVKVIYTTVKWKANSNLERDLTVFLASQLGVEKKRERFMHQSDVEMV